MPVTLDQSLDHSLTDGATAAGLTESGDHGATKGTPAAAAPSTRPATRHYMLKHSQDLSLTPDDIPTDPTIKDLMTIIIKNHNETSAVLTRIDCRLDEYETSLDFAHAKITDNESEINKVRLENSELRKMITELSFRLDSSEIAIKRDVEAVKTRQDQAERRSRDFGIRVHGVAEGNREDTRIVLSGLIAKHKLAGLSTPSLASQAIEHCHRLGNKGPDGRPRAIIANMFSRPLRYQLIKDARVVNNDKANPAFFAPDMLKADHTLKMKARDQLKRAHDAGHLFA